jgi:hypothetical protein
VAVVHHFLENNFHFLFGEQFFQIALKFFNLTNQKLSRNATEHGKQCDAVEKKD